MTTEFDTLGCPFCNALCRPEEYIQHVDSCMRIAVSDGRDAPTGPPLADQLKPYGGSAGSGPPDRPDGGSGGGLFGRWRG